MMIIMAGMMARKDLVEKLNEAIQEWKLNPTDGNYGKIEMFSVVVFLKASMKSDGAKGSAELIEELKKQDRRNFMYENKDN